MSSFRVFSPVFASLVLGWMGWVSSAGFAWAEPYIKGVWDFKANPPTYGYERWEDLGSVGTRTESGWQLSGPAAGGFGLVFHQLLDLSDAKTFRIVMVPEFGMTDERIMVKLHTADGRNASWDVPVKELERGVETVVELDLSAPTEKSDEEGLDFGIVQQIQLQGTFNPSANVQVTMVRFEAQ